MNLRTALLSVSSLTLLSRIAGFARDWLIALTFGSSAAADAFFVAFRFPNLLRRLFAEGAFSQAFVPMLVAQKNLGENSYRQFINKTSFILIFAVGLITIIGVIFAKELIILTAPGFTKDPEKMSLTVTLTRICFPYIFFVSLLSLISAILQCEKKFTLPALSPLFLNLAMIGGILFTINWWEKPVLVLAYSVLVGGFIQLAIPAYGVYRAKLLPKPDHNWQAPAVKEMLKNMLPAILGVASGQLNLLFNTIFASFLITGSVSWLYYADRLMELPVGLLGAALAVIVLPSLSQAVISHNNQRVSLLVDWGLRLTLLISLPCAIAYIICGPAIFLTLFKYGSFTVEDAQKSGAALSFYAIGLLPLIGQKVLAPVFYAHKDLKTPAKIGFLALIINQAQNFIWVPMFAHSGLALSIAVTALIQFGVLLFLLLKQKKIFFSKSLLIFFGKQLFVLAIFSGFLLYFTPEFNWWVNAENLEKIIKLTIIIISAMTIYILMWWALGLRAKDFSISS